jgi:hypothetical protein
MDGYSSRTLHNRATGPMEALGYWSLDYKTRENNNQPHPIEHGEDMWIAIMAALFVAALMRER